MLPPLSVRQGLLLCAVCACFSLPALAQNFPPVSGERNITGARPGEQLWPALALGNTGGLLVCEDNRIENGNNSGIAGFLLDSSLLSSGLPFRVNSAIAGAQEKPTATVLSDGRYLVTWETRLGGKAGVQARIVAANGSMASPELQLTPSTVTVSSKVTTNWPGIFRNRAANRKYKFRETITFVREHSGASAAAALGDGRAVVVYHSVCRANTNTWGLVRQTSWNGSKSKTNDVLRPVRLLGDSMQDVFMRFLDGSGQLSGNEIQVNQYTPSNQRTPSAVVLSGGNILVTWVTEQPRSASVSSNFVVRLVGRLFTSTGDAVSDEFVVSDNDNVANANPVASALPEGGFAVLWSRLNPFGPEQWDVVIRKFAANGAPEAAAVVVNQHTEGVQFGPRVASIGGNQMAVWTSVNQDGSREGVYGRILANGVPTGDEFRVNTTTVSRQMNPAIASNGADRFVAVWTSYVGETGFDLFAREYSAAQAR